MPTLAALAGVKLVDPDVDGKSLAKVIASADAPTPHEAVHWQVGEDAAAQWAVRDGDWKLIGNVRDTSEPGRGLASLRRPTRSCSCPTSPTTRARLATTPPTTPTSSTVFAACTKSGSVASSVR